MDMPSCSGKFTHSFYPRTLVRKIYSVYSIKQYLMSHIYTVYIYHSYIFQFLILDLEKNRINHLSTIVHLMHQWLYFMQLHFIFKL